MKVLGLSPLDKDSTESIVEDGRITVTRPLKSDSHG